MKTHEPSVVLAGGGTAGHISPLLAIAGAIREQAPDAAILAVGTAAGMETRLVPAAGYELATIERVPFPRRPSLDLLKLPFRFGTAVKQARRIIEGAAADVVVGVGGYVSTPMYIAAKLAKVPDGWTGSHIAAEVKKRGFVIATGYGKLKDQTFRIGHMGDHTIDRLEALLASLKKVLKR